ncbi:MAG TPA: primosomal protein N' [Clostridiaceae bacterium]|nr:primosomal protein N' [Clostridiaceae bacterium]
MQYAGIVVNNEAQAMDRIFTYKVPEGHSLAVGQRVQVPFGMGNKKVDGFVLCVLAELEGKVRGLKEITTIYPGSFFGEFSVQLIEELRKRYLCTYIEAIRVMIPVGTLKGMNFKTAEKLYAVGEPEGRYDKENYRAIVDLVKRNQGKFIKSDVVKQGFSMSSLNTLIRAGCLEVSSEHSYRYSIAEYEEYCAPVLNVEQQAASDRIMSTPGTYLIHGITGSGKTEIFLDVIRCMLEEGKDSIVLVPEISLTPQMIERFKGRFGKEVSIYHSRLSDGERFDEWHRVKSGQVKIAIGARSALFLPFQDLGLIVIDEEHEGTYKSEMSPKYSAVEMAEFMMGQRGGRLVLASATPSIESYYRAMKKEITLIELKKRATIGTLPVMETVDMREELKKGNRSIFSHSLRTEIEEALKNKEQVILFLNRRGFSTFVSCRSCGMVFRCPNCDVSLTYHNNSNLTCHHCGFRRSLPKVCPKCESKYIKQFGTGTEKVEELVRKEFPEANVIRMDRDTAKSKSAYDDMYNSFKNNEGDILIGTQMITKGLDFKGVTLVGILAADLSLNLPDFRAGERTFQLITQVAGRAGRGDKEGKVIIQSYEPTNPSIVSAKNHDYKGYYKREIRAREILKNPPFTRMVAIVLNSEHEQNLIKCIQLIGNELRNFLTKHDTMVMLGPSPCLISKIKNNYRWQIILKGQITSELAREIKDLVLEHNKDKEIKTSFDINPNSLF